MGGGNYYNVIRISTLFSWGGWYSDTLKRYKVCGLVLTVQFKCEFLSNSHQDSSRIWTQDNALYSVHCAEKMYMGRLTCSSGSTRFLTFSSRDSEPSVCNEHSENLIIFFCTTWTDIKYSHIIYTTTGIGRADIHMNFFLPLRCFLHYVIQS